MKKILPLATPKIRAYAKHAHIFSILGVWSDNFIPWIYNYYMQLYVPEEYHEFKVDYLIPSIFTYAPNLFVSRIERQMALNIRDRSIDSLKYYIDMDYYIYTILEVSQISTYNCKRFRTHDPMLYGYDDEKEEFYFVDTYQDGKYATGVASYEEIERAIGTVNKWSNWGVTDWVLDIVCMKYKDLGVSFQFTPQMYVKLLTEYLDQKDSYYLHWGVHGWEKGTKGQEIYGIGVYSFLRRYLMYGGEVNKRLDVRGFYVIWEHKQILEKGLNYLLGDKWSRLHPIENQLLQSVISDATIMRNLCLKYNITQKKELLMRIYQYSINIEEKEKKLISNLVRLINSSVDENYM